MIKNLIIHRLALKTSILFLLNLPLHTAADTLLPTNSVIVSGQATISTPSSNRITVDQTSDRAIVNWQGFSVGANNAVTFQQPTATSAILNRVTGDSTSTIAGQINANGQVFLVNPNGIAITSSGSVKVGGGFVASTLDIADQDFESSNIRFNGAGPIGSIENHGSISTDAHGFVALLGNRVLNTGVISVPLGKVAIGTGQQMALDFNGGGFLQVAMPGEATDGAKPLVDVSGSIFANGGRIEIKTATALDAIHDIVNVSGNLVAHAISSKDGIIILDAGVGGQVKLDHGALLDTASMHGKGGLISITGNSIEIEHAGLNADGATGGGTILIGGEYQGGGTMRHAIATTVGNQAWISANATQDGDGGKVVLWSDAVTEFDGNILARGAGQGNGGIAEVSSHGLLAYDGMVDLRSDAGSTGDLLLDPYNVTISTGSNSNQTGFTATGNNSVINITALQTALATANVNVSTNTLSNGAQSGDIALANALSWSSGNNLTLNAYRDITINSGATVTAVNGGAFNLNAGRNIAVNATISATNNALNVTAAAGALINGATAGLGTFDLTGATIDTHNGPLTVTARSSSANAISLTNATINLGSGSGSFTAINTGTAANSNGISLSGTTALAAANLNFSGSVTAGSQNGIFFANAGSLTSTGNITLTGNASGSAAGNASNFQGNFTVNNTGGNLAITGASANGATGLRFNAGSVALNNHSTGSLAITGESTGSGAGIRTVAGTAITSNGNASFLGKSNSTLEAWRVDGNTSITQTSGALILAGESTSNLGLRVRAGTLSLTNNTASTLVFTNITPSVGVQVDNNAGLAATGNVTLVGNSSGNQAGVLVTSNNSIVNNGTGIFRVQGSSSGNNSNAVGILFNGGTKAITNNSSGSIELDGGNTYINTINDYMDGIRVIGNSVINASGTVSLSGHVLNGEGAGIFLNSATLHSGGNTTLTGTGSGLSSIGLEIQGGVFETLNGGNLNMSGSSTHNYGAYVSADTNFLNANGGSFALTGNSINNIGIFVTAGSDISVTGNVNIHAETATNNPYSAIFLEGNNSFINNGSGVFSITGTSSGFANGIYLNADTLSLSNNSSGSILFEGKNINTTASNNKYYGVATNILGTSNAINTTGNVSLVGLVNEGKGSGVVLFKTNLTSNGVTTISGTGTAGTARGVQFEGGNTVTLNGGSLNIGGISGLDSGLQVRNSATFNRNAGTLTLNGSSTSYRGIDGFSGAQWTFNGNATLNGDSTSWRGIRLENNQITVNSGNVAFNGTSGSDVGLLFKTVSTFNHSNHVLQLNGSSASGYGLVVESGSFLGIDGDTALAGTSNTGTGLQVNSDAIIAQNYGHLQMSGSSNQGLGFNMQNGTILNNDSGSLVLQSNHDMTVDGAIISSSGEVSLLSTGDLTLNSNASVIGKNPVLSATGGFINAAGSAAVSTTSGRWLVYSANPNSDSFGDLNSENTAIWNSSYTSLPPASVGAVGNRYIFAYQPTLQITSTHLNKPYGIDATNSISSQYAITGIESGVTNAYLADVASALFSGAPSISSLGAAANAGAGGGVFSVNVEPGTLQVNPGYGIAFHNSGLLTVSLRSYLNDASLHPGNEPNNPVDLFNGTLKLADGSINSSGMSKPQGIASEVLYAKKPLQYTDLLYPNFNNSRIE